MEKGGGEIEGASMMQGRRIITEAIKGIGKQKGKGSSIKVNKE